MTWEGILVAIGLKTPATLDNKVSKLINKREQVKDEIERTEQGIVQTMENLARKQSAVGGVKERLIGNLGGGSNV
jgi:hypothetical protein